LSKERRVHARVPMMVRVVDGETGEVKQYFSREISIGGVYLETTEPYAVGEVLRLQFQIPGTEFEADIRGEIVHRAESDTPKEPAGIGLKFIDMDGRSEQLIEEYVEKLERIRQKLSE